MQHFLKEENIRLRKEQDRKQEGKMRLIDNVARVTFDNQNGKDLTKVQVVTLDRLTPAPERELRRQNNNDDDDGDSHQQHDISFQEEIARQHAFFEKLTSKCSRQEEIARPFAQQEGGRDGVTCSNNIAFRNHKDNIDVEDSILSKVIHQSRVEEQERLVREIMSVLLRAEAELQNLLEVIPELRVQLQSSVTELEKIKREK